MNYYNYIACKATQFTENVLSSRTFFDRDRDSLASVDPASRDQLLHAAFHLPLVLQLIFTRAGQLFFAQVIELWNKTIKQKKKIMEA